MKVRKALSIILVFCMLVGMLPVSVWADEEDTSGSETIECGDFTSYLKWTDYANLPSFGTWVLTTDVTIATPWIVGNNVSICLNGHTITCEVGIYWSGSDYMIEVKDRAKLEIYDHTGEGKIVGDESIPIVGVTNGTFNLYNGTLTGGSGGVYLEHADDQYHDSVFNMYGGSIINNNGTDFGGVYSYNGTFNVSGAAVVKDNTVNGNTSNVRLSSGSVINVVGELSVGTWIGVRTDYYLNYGEVSAVTSGLLGNGDAVSFSSDEEGMVITTAVNGEAVIGWPAVVSFSAGGGSGRMNDETVAAGSTYMLPFPSFAAPSGKTFEGWIVNGEGDPVEAGQTITVTGDTTLEASWKTGSGMIEEHKHVWKIMIDEETDPSLANVTCIGTQLSSDDCDYRGSKRWVKLNTSVTEKTYDGKNTITASIEKEAASEANRWVGFPDESLIVVGNPYWLTADGTAVSAPIEVGDYVAEATIAAANSSGNVLYLRKYVTIKKLPAPDVQVTGLTNLPLTDEGEELVTVVGPDDLSDYGTLWFRLGADGEWTTEIPKSSESGEHTVYWYFESSHYENIGSELEPQSVTATVSALHEHDGIRFTQWTEADSLPAEAGNYFLTGEVTLTGTWTVSNEINLCLNGNTICGNQQIRIAEGGALTLYGEEGGSLKDLAGDGGAVLIEEGGSLITHGVDMETLTGDYFPHALGTGTTPTTLAGAVTVRGTFVMDGGSITACEGIRGGVLVDGGSFTISGKIVIADNKMRYTEENNGSNVYLTEGSVITIGGELEEGTSIGVRTKYNSDDGRLPAKGEEITWTSGYAAYMGEEDPTVYFSHDYSYVDPKYIVCANDAGEVILTLHKHNFVLTADDENDVVTVKCTNPYCDFGTNTEYTVSLAAEDAEFDNNVHEAVVTNGLPDDMEVECCLSYTNADGTEVETDSLSGAPDEIGDYFAVLKVVPEGNWDAMVSVSKAFSITEPAVPEAYVTAEPVENVFYNNGKNVRIVNFKDWDPQNIQFLVYWVDDGDPYYYWKDGTPWGASTLPMASSVGTHTVYYYIPAASDGSYKAYGSEEEPLSVQVTIKQKYTVKFDEGDGSGTMDSLELFPETPNGSVRYTLPESEFASPESYMGFAGWKLSTTDEVKFPGEEIEVTGDLTLTAQFSLYHSIFVGSDVDGGGTVTASKKEDVVTGEKITLTVELEDGYMLKSLTASSWTSDVTITDRTFIMPDSDVWVAPDFEIGEPAFKTQSLLLSGQIGVVFFLDLPEIGGVNYDESYMEFSVSGKDGAVTEVPYSEASLNPSGTYYGFTCYISSIQMADTITATFHYGDNKTIEKTYSAVEYLNYIAEGDYNEPLKNICAAINDYGYYAQQYLSPLRGWSLGTDHAAMTSASELTETDIEAAKEAVSDYGLQCAIGDAQIKKVTYSLVLDSETGIRFYLTPKDGFTGDVTAFLGDDTGNNLAVKQSDGRYLVSISGIVAHKLGETCTVKVTAGETFEIKASALSYVRSVLKSSSTSEAFKKSMTAMYNYYARAAELIA